MLCPVSMQVILHYLPLCVYVKFHLLANQFAQGAACQSYVRVGAACKGRKEQHWGMCTAKSAAPL